MFRKEDVISLVPVESIPLAGETPVGDLMMLFRLANKMEKICADEKGIGLSAVQVGIPWNFFVVQRRGGVFDHYVNCTYEGSGRKVKSVEGCLSLKGADGRCRMFEVDRHEKIDVKGKQLVLSGVGLSLNDIDFPTTGLHAVVMQHEIDHASGILISRGREIEMIP